MDECIGTFMGTRPIMNLKNELISNVLYLFGKLGMTDTLDGEKFDACLDLINFVLNDMLYGKNSEYLKTYDSLDVVLFLISRFAKYSENGMEWFRKS